jgi:hypothetical protein
MTVKLEPLRYAGLYIGDVDFVHQETIDEHKINRLLYWDDMVLYDLENDPITDDYDGTEKMRNLTLISDFSKIVKMFPDVIVTIPYQYRTLQCRIIQKSLELKYKNTTSEDIIVEQNDEYSVTKSTRVQYEIRATPKIKKEILMRDLYREYLDFPVSTSFINSVFDTESKSNSLFRFTIPGTKYHIGFLLNGQIISIKLESDITAENIIEMSRYFNSALQDIIETSKVCKEIEQQEEEHEERESTTSYQCTR